MEPTLRDATLDDAQFLFDLRTDPDVAAASNRAAPPGLAEHIGWLTRALEDHDVRVFIVEDEYHLPIGQVRLDQTADDSAEVSIALVSAARGHGTGTEVLKILALAAEHHGIRWLEAVIKETNHASRKAFLKAGYSVEEIKDGLVHMGYKCGS